MRPAEKGIVTAGFLADRHGGMPAQGAAGASSRPAFRCAARRRAGGCGRGAAGFAVCRRQSRPGRSGRWHGRRTRRRMRRLRNGWRLCPAQPPRGRGVHAPARCDRLLRDSAAAVSEVRAELRQRATPPAARAWRHVAPGRGRQGRWTSSEPGTAAIRLHASTASRPRDLLKILTPSVVHVTSGIKHDPRRIHRGKAKQHCVNAS